MAVVRDFSAERLLPTWYGTKDDVLALVQSVQEHFAPERDSAESQLTDGDSIDDRFARIDYKHTWRTEATLTESDGSSSSGPLDELLKATPAGRIRELTYSYPGHVGSRTGPRVGLRFDRNQGLRVTTTGHREVEIRVLASAVGDRASLNSPPWGWLVGTGWGIVAVCSAAAVLFGGLVAATVSHYEPAAFYFPAGTWSGALASAVASAWITNRRLNPRFQLLEPGARSRTERVLYWLGGLAIGIFISVVVTFATR